LKVVLKGLKQDTYNGCNACIVCDGSVIMSNPNYFAYFIAFRVTWLPCPSRINKCWLVKDIPPQTNFLKKDKNSLNKKIIIHVFFALPYMYLVCKI
jgi:hypothetical protein